MDEEEKIEEKCEFLLLPECVLRVLFSYLDSTTLYQLTRTCHYFHDIITEPIFWRYIDARRSPNTNHKVQYCTDRVHEKTTHVFLKAQDKYCGLVSYNFFKTINPYRNIRILALENQRFNGSRLSLKDFPSCLEELSLKKTNIKSSTYFFQHSGQKMQKLRVLILDQCQWVTSSFLMSVAKYESLEIISAVKCLRLHLNMVPYLNVARYGCKNLKVFDSRFTSIGHEALRTFCPKESLQSLYFQSLKSAEGDYSESIFNASYMRAECESRPREGDSSVCDESFFEYINSLACDITDKLPNSVLYKDPYPDCSCNKNNQSDPPPMINFDEYYVYTPRKRKPVKFVCQRHVQDVERLSNHFREFFLSNQHQFYADRASEVESEPGTSDSESDDGCGTCCMYGMGRSMILLTPGNNPGTIQEEVLELNPEEHEQGGRVVSIFISTPLRESFNNNGQNNGNAVPGTSRNVQEDSVNGNLENLRNESKRRHSEDKDQEEAGENESKRPRRNDNLEQVSDELIQSTDKMAKNMNEFIQNSGDVGNRSVNISQEGEPTTLSQNNASAIAGTSMGVQENSINENLENLRNESKRRCSEDKDLEETGENKSKRPRRNDILGQVSDEVKVAEVNELIQSADRMTKNMNEFIQNSMNVCNRGVNSRQERGPTTSRVQDVVEMNNTNRLQGEQSSSRGVPSGSRNIPSTDHNMASTSNEIRPNAIQFENENRIEVQINRDFTGGESLSDENPIDIILDPGGSLRRHAGNNGPRTAIITMRNRERSRYVNPLFVQIESKHIKKKSRLRRLSLRGFRRITDLTLVYIKNLKLDLLDLTYTSVTKEGIENFLGYNPNCRIIHPLYCICKPLNPF